MTSAQLSQGKARPIAQTYLPTMEPGTPAPVTAVGFLPRFLGQRTRMPFSQDRFARVQQGIRLALASTSISECERRFLRDMQAKLDDTRPAVERFPELFRSVAGFTAAKTISPAGHARARRRCDRGVGHTHSLRLARLRREGHRPRTACDSADAPTSRRADADVPPERTHQQ